MTFDRDRENIESAPPRFRAPAMWVAAIALVACGLTLFLLAVRSRGGMLEQVRAIKAQAPFEALQLLERAIDDVDGNYPDAQIMKCEILGELQGWRAAERYYDSIESPAASDPEVLIALAMAANQHQAAWLADKALEAANRPGPHQEQVVRLLMGVKYDLGENAAVLKLCEQLAQLAPQDSEPWLVAAGIHHETEQLAQALIDYREALVRSPPEQEGLRVRLQIAEVSLHLGDLEAAEQQIRILRNVSPGVTTMDLAYAKLLRRKGRDADAKAVVEQIVAKEPQFPGGLMLRGQLRFDEGEFRAAVADFRAVVAINPYDHRAHYKLAQAYQRLQMTEESGREFAESRRLTDAVSQILILGRQLDQNPTSRELRLKLAEQHLILGNTRSAEHWRRTAEGISED